MEKLKGLKREALLQQCLDGDVSAARMLEMARAAIEYLASVADPDTGGPSGAIVGSIVKETHEQPAR